MHSISTFLLLATATLASAAEPQSIAASVRAKLKQYNQGAKQHAKSLRVCYFIPKGRTGAKEYLARTQATMLDFQAWFKAEMKRNGYPDKTLRLELGKDNKPVIHVVRGKRKADEYSYQDGQTIRRECAAVLKAKGIANVNDETLLIIQDMMYEPNPEHFTQKAPYYGGGSFRSGTAWCTDCRVLAIPNLNAPGPRTRYQRHAMSRGQYNSTMIGGMIHELGHALQLPHNREAPSERRPLGTALMGAGNYTYGREKWTRGRAKGSFLTLASATRLASHPLFTGSAKGRATDPTAQIETAFDHPAGKRTLVVRGQVKSANVPAYAVVVYNDPAGGSDYDAQTVVGALDKQGNFSLTMNNIRDGEYELRVTFCHANGGVSHQKMQYTCTDGTIVFAKEDSKAFRAALAAVYRDRGRLTRATKIATVGLKANPKDTALQQLVAALKWTNDLRSGKLTGKPGRALSAAELAKAGHKTADLAACRWTSAKVGWHGVMAGGVLPVSTVRGVASAVRSKETVYPNGIWAHSPSKYAFDLGGAWVTLEANVGLLRGGTGRVVFRIVGDGKTLWTSKRVGDNQDNAVKVSVKGVKLLELHVDPLAGNNNGGWGVWMAPRLSR